MKHRMRAFLGVLCAVPTASAIVTTTVDLVDPSDGGAQPPPGVICVDVLVDVTLNDVWIGGGIRGLITPSGLADGLAIRYSSVPDDPNTPHFEYLLNPGVDQRFVTFLTKPRGRDDAERYTDAGVQLAGRMSPAGPIETASQAEVNVVWFAWPPEGPDSPSVSGATARVALDVSSFLISHPLFEAFHVGLPSSATGPILFQSSTNEGFPGTVSLSFARHNFDTDWALWYTEIPEPSSVFFLSFGIVVFRRVHRLRGSLR